MRSRKAGKARTVIRPHSLYEMTHQRKSTKLAHRRLRSGKAPVLRRHQTARHWSTRPILRDSLLQQLQMRLDDAFVDLVRRFRR
jgi:hypothetical protein